MGCGGFLPVGDRVGSHSLETDFQRLEPRSEQGASWFSPPAGAALAFPALGPVLWLCVPCTPTAGRRGEFFSFKLFLQTKAVCSVRKNREGSPRPATPNMALPVAPEGHCAARAAAAKRSSTQCAVLGCSAIQAQQSRPASGSGPCYSLWYSLSHL